jgi:hypothetical protein
MSDEKTEAQSKLAETCAAAGVRVGHVYQHYRGGLYVVFAVSLAEATLLPYVHYYSLERGTRWTRPLANFSAVMNVDTARVQRFERVRPATNDELARAIGVREVAS